MISQTPWIERKFDFNFPVGLFPVIIERLKGTLPRIEELIKNKNDEDLAEKISGAWSVKEQIGHLYDLEDLWYGRIEDFFAGKETLRAADMTNSKTHGADHNKRKIRDILRQFSSARNKLVSKVDNIDESTASKTSLHPRLQKPMRLIDSLFFVAEHDDHHIAKIRELLNN
jgi:uncharacterized damage-inducible protein DinB